MKQEWRMRALPKKVHLTISGCLGPCDASNVVLIMMGDYPLWLGGLDRHEHYAAITDWASACDRAGAVVPLPASLAPFRMDRFQGDLLDVPLFEPAPLCPDAKVV
jgi:cobaltochelatase CobN